MKCDNCGNEMTKTNITDDDTEEIIEVYMCFHCGNNAPTNKAE